MSKLRKEIIRKFINSNTIKRWIKKYSIEEVYSSQNNNEECLTVERINTQQNRIKDFPVIVKNQPKILNLELTNKCIMKCCMCPRTLSMTREQGFMPLEVFKKIIDEYTSFNIQDDSILWLHHFGESLLHPDFDRAIEYAISKGLLTGLSLNPLALTEEKALRLFKAKPSVIFFMMDGDDNESFYKIRGVKDAYEISVKNAIRGIEIKEEYSPDTDLQITIVDNPAFKKNVDNVVKFWKEEHNITVQKKSFWTWNGDVDSINKMGYCYEHPDVCSIPWENLCITWDSLVVPCCSDYNNLNVLGDLKKQSLTEVWNSEPMQKLRSELKSGDIKNDLCKKCMYTKHNNNKHMEGINKISTKNAIVGSYVTGQNTTMQASSCVYNYRSPDAITIGSNTNIEGKLVNYPYGGTIKIGDYSHYGEGGHIYCTCNVEIGNNVLIAHNVDIFDNDTHPIDPIAREEHYKSVISGKNLPEKCLWDEKPINICDNAWIGAKAVILKGVTIGECAIVAAGSIVTKDVEPYTIVAGNPAKKINDIPKSSCKKLCK